MKYIRVKVLDGDDEIITFPESINHDVMYQSVSRMKDKLRGDWKRVSRRVVSAGFVDSKHRCHGRSETLGLESNPDDTNILKSQF